MTEQVMELVRALGGAGQEDVLRALCGGACRMLDRRLKDGVTAEECGEYYRLAAAWTVLDWLRAGQGMEGVTALSAGDISVRREGGWDGGGLARRALELMAPHFRDEGFAFRGVSG